MFRRPRIAIAGFQHETNTFAPFGATYQDFVKADGWPALTTGEAILPLFRSVNIPIGGFIVAAGDFDLVPIVWASAEPCSYVADDAFDRIAGMICGPFAVMFQETEQVARRADVKGFFSGPNADLVFFYGVTK
jgi:microcystin degradation protein MlrC